mmetsp:Transcript_28208/g.84397  ORF Transcript_28208/g.84397 Transcript_28208/m.84397 type:complete len:222 (+) Transcript_28208:1856-2521(+)
MARANKTPCELFANGAATPGKFAFTSATARRSSRAMLLQAATKRFSCLACTAVSATVSSAKKISPLYETHSSCPSWAVVVAVVVIVVVTVVDVVEVGVEVCDEVPVVVGVLREQSSNVPSYVNASRASFKVVATRVHRSMAVKTNGPRPGTRLVHATEASLPPKARRIVDNACGIPLPCWQSVALVVMRGWYGVPDVENARVKLPHASSDDTSGLHSRRSC